MALLSVSGAGVLVVQASVLTRLPIMPDLLLIFCVYLGIYHRSVGAAAAVFLLGFALDSSTGTPVGVNAFALSVVYATVVFAARCLWLRNPIAVLGMVCVGALLKTGSYIFLIEWSQLASAVEPVMARTMVWDAALAMTMAPLVFGVLGRGERTEL